MGLLGAAVLGPALYAALAPEPRSTPPRLPALTPEATRYGVWVVDWGYHSALVVQAPPQWRLGPPGRESAPLVEFAWGERAFYLESDFRPHALAAALLWPTGSVAYVRAHERPPDPDRADAVWHREVSADTLRALVRSLEASFVRADSGGAASGGRAAAYVPAEGYAGRFYRARGAYLWTRDCNWWTVARLADAGLAWRPAGVVVTPQIGRRLRGFRRVEPAGLARYRSREVHPREASPPAPEASG